MPSIDLSFLLDDPSDADVQGSLRIEALAPLSMNASVPGKHYQTETVPPKRQIYGMIENALGLHFGWSNKEFGYKLKRKIAEAASADVSISGIGTRDFQPLVAPYYELSLAEEPAVETFDDTQWLHKWRDTSQVRVSASNHDWRATGDKPERYGYGKTPIQREYVIPEGPWIYAVITTPSAGRALQAALDAPKGSLYLGTSDGWVDASFQFDPAQQ
jgi:hypothetical protein